MTSLVVLSSYGKRMNFSTRKKVTKTYHRIYIIILTDLPNAINKMWGGGS